MSNKIFILGVGCQKGGTTWLHDYLSSKEDCQLSNIKELHIFDTYFMPTQSVSNHQNTYLRAINLLEKKRKILHKHTPQLEKNILEAFDHIKMGINLDHYTQFFKNLAKDEKINAVGEITPSYSILNRDHFTTIKNLIEDAGFQLKIIFLMRDPLERIYSTLKMRDRELMEKKLPNSSGLAHLRFKDEYHLSKHSIRTRYDKTIIELEAAFSPSQIYYGFYETLFKQQTLDDLSKFLNVSPSLGKLNKKINAAPKTSINIKQPEGYKEARKFYAETYDFCLSKFGTRLADIWQNV